ncbi:hotdog domain-containing protein [Aquihabitans sp. McL0605]|uniref:PaaI family thioesterase n=1 Tax=Aquihabitans sp. McL0605 TaxID=3415671 RepID=UPI003CF79F5F
MTSVPPPAGALGTDGHIVAQLGLRVDHTDHGVGGRGLVLPEACIPGTDVLRTSVLATWSDVVTGHAAGDTIAPRIPLTLDLEIQLVTPIRVGTVVAVEAATVKAGRTIVVAQAEFRDQASGELLAFSYASFVPSADPAAVFPDGFPRNALDGRLTEPLIDRVGSRVVERGTAEVPHRPDGLNAVGAIQGGLLVFGAEEAAASLADGPVVAESITARYLRPFVVGPARAVARGEAPGLSVVEVSDAGAGKLGLVATVRSRPLPT